MMILPVTDAIIMRWTAGMLDIPQGKTATNLYRFFKLKEDRVKKSESDLFLKTVFNAGDGEVLDNMSVNQDFPQLWNTLLEEVVKYIDKYEQKDSAFDVVSKSAIFQSIRDLQYNLTVFTSGMVKAILPEMYKQLEHAISILDDDNVKNQLGRGYRRSMWNVIERISMEEFNYAPNVSAYRTIAVNGHKIFTTIASFNESLISEEEFRTFIHNVEEFIIAQSQVGEKPDIENEDDEGMLEDDEAVMDEIEKDDWDF
jgi:hypothetical protein